MSQEPLVEAYRAANGPQAHLVANFLQEAGIPAFVDGDELGGGAGGLPAGWATAPRVLVPKTELAHARTLIEAAEHIDDGPLVEEN
ncbi:DUF2007 domain-containing protein [bacterium]|nr:DUF2007 domain-containing protein [bacterium]